MKPLKTVSLEELTDKHIGKKGTAKREAFEYELRLISWEKPSRQSEKRET